MKLSERALYHIGLLSRILISRALSKDLFSAHWSTLLYLRQTGQLLVTGAKVNYILLNTSIAYK